jgi:subtilisin family serine protease
MLWNMHAFRFQPDHRVLEPDLDEHKEDRPDLNWPDLNWPDLNWPVQTRPNLDLFAPRLIHGSGKTMHLEATRLLIALHRKPDQLEDRLHGLGLELETTPENGSAAINHSKCRHWIRSTSNETLHRELLLRLQNELADCLDWFGPVYRINNAPGLEHLLCPLPNVLLIRPTAQARSVDLNAILRGYGLEEEPEKSKYLGEYRYFKVPDLRQTNAHRLRDLLLRNEPDLLHEVRLENMPMLRDDCAIPNDQYFPLQWNMLQIQAGGPGRTGWDISTGNETVIVAVIDTGCDLNHPDIRYTDIGANLAHLNQPGTPVQGQPHGTSCAGIIAASINNSLGVAGVAGSCKIMSLARENLTDVELMIGLEFAAQHGAKVINLSFGERLTNDNQITPSKPSGPTAPRVWDTTLIDTAIEQAVLVRGMVLCAASGNDDAASIRYPARHPLVMACGATDRRDQRKRKRLGDLRGWGSNYGNSQHAQAATGVSVMAPGVNIPTTATSGLSGNDPDGYHLNFWGTSAATPHVAGLAALLFSAHPALNGLQVRKIIEQSAEKVGGTYRKHPDFPNGTHNQEMGYGRINVLRALKAAEKMLKQKK